jgi:dihydrofolate reductase
LLATVARTENKETDVGKVVVSKSISLDGFVAGPNVGVEFPMGVGGLRLHEWFLNGPTSDANATLQRDSIAAYGAVILGKRTYDVGVDLWEDTPYPLPTFVLTHGAQPERVAKSATFTFVTDGIASALDKAQAAAGDKDVVLMGADVSAQYLKAGLVDEIQLAVIPVLLSSGTRLFDGIGDEQIELDPTLVVESAGVTHMRMRVVR